MNSTKHSFADNAIDVFVESRRTRTHVGRLSRDGTGYCFKYERAYIMDSKSIPLGPEFPLTKLTHSAKSMFLSLLDRIPSRDNPAYPEYCKTAGIEVDEENELILLSTIGRRGPSSFIFEPVIEELSFDLRAFRNELELSIRDFATAFGISFATVQRIESGKVSGREVLKRVELYKRFPEAALFELERNRTRLHRATYERTLTRLSDTNGSKQ